MYNLFIGNYERVMGMTVYYKKGKKYIPCVVTNYYFKSREYALVPIADLENASSERRVIYTTKIYTV